MEHSSFLLLLISPVFIVGLGLWVLRWLEGEHRRKSPIAGKVCRYPGFTLSKEIEQLDESLSIDLATLLLIPAVSIGVIGIGRFEDSGVSFWVIFGGAYITGIGFIVVRLFRNSRKIRIKRLGFAGEQVVGHQLSELLRSGFHVFHDFPLTYGNIDHVVVGPSGVFAIETKYKRKAKDVKDGHKLQFNQRVIKFPDSSETSKPLKQAASQAEELSERLTKLFGKTDVVPIVVYPGWFVTKDEGTAEVPVQVTNDKFLITMLSRKYQTINDEMIKRIAAFFDEICRDIEI